MNTDKIKDALNGVAQAVVDGMKVCVDVTLSDELLCYPYIEDDELDLYYVGEDNPQSISSIIIEAFELQFNGGDKNDFDEFKAMWDETKRIIDEKIKEIEK